ncbi:hypothetical protein KO495_16210 [Colwellia sp. D2M02]|nr:hypothetical protein [Colwellia sp. D2M02]
MVLFCLFVVSTTLNAQQTYFNKAAIDKGYQFTYQWLDYNDQTQKLSFQLTQQSLFDRFRQLKSYQASYAQKAILRRLKQHLRKKPVQGVQVSFRQTNGEYRINVKGQDQQKVSKTYQQLIKLESTIQQQYFQENYYQPFTNHDNITGIKVDHGAIANDSVDDLKLMKPIILEQVSIQNIRQVTNYVLGFVQSIPYSPLESRINSSGSGFNNPTKVLWENQGDCDSKMTLTASILRGLMPRIEMALLYIDKHAFIGISIPSEAGEVSIEHQGVHYVLAEPTGPALLPLGQLAPESKLAIDQGRYTVEPYHEVINSTANNDD